MSTEGPRVHPYIITLPQEIIGQLATGRDLNGIDRFFYGLIHNSPTEKDLPYQLLFNDPLISGAVNGYLNYLSESGKITNAIRYLTSRYRNMNPEDLEEIVYFSVWRSFFAYPWENGYRETELNTYIYTSMRYLTREVRQRNDGLYEPVEEQRFSSSEIKSHPFAVSQQASPHDIALEAMFAEDLAIKLVDKTTRDNVNLKQLKLKALRLLSEGIEPKDIADLLGIQHARLKGWLRAFQEVDMIDRSDRVDVDAKGNWRWTQHTAQVILNNPFAKNLLTETELRLLENLSKGRSYSDIIMEDSSLHISPQVIKHKIRSHGQMSGASHETYQPRRKQLIFFLNYIKPTTEEERLIIQALYECEGNVYKASRMIQIPRGKVLYFLEQKGWYLK